MVWSNSFSRQHMHGMYIYKHYTRIHNIYIQESSMTITFSKLIFRIILGNYLPNSIDVMHHLLNRIRHDTWYSCFLTTIYSMKCIKQNISLMIWVFRKQLRFVEKQSQKCNTSNSNLRYKNYHFILLKNLKYFAFYRLFRAFLYIFFN